jgi:LuxR family maltose regulon positive regulatory protein
MTSMPAELRELSLPRSSGRGPGTRKFRLLALESGLAEAADHERESEQMMSALPAPRVLDDNLPAAIMARAPVLDDSVSALILRGWLVQSLLLDAIVRDAAADAAAAEHALERALDLAERDRVLLPFLVHPVPELLERHARRRTAHADLISEIFSLLAGQQVASPPPEADSLREPLTESETRVLRYLPTNLSKRDIANELYVSVNTIKTHVKHLYAKLDVQTRRQAVERARELGLLSHSLRARRASAHRRPEINRSEA